MPVHSSVAFHRVPVWQKSLLVYHLSSISFPLRRYPLASKWAHVTSTAVWKNEMACVQKQQYKTPIIVLNIFLQDSEFGKIGKNPCEEWISSFDQKRKYQKPKPKIYFHKNHRTSAQYVQCNHKIKFQIQNTRNKLTIWRQESSEKMIVGQILVHFNRLEKHVPKNTKILSTLASHDKHTAMSVCLSSSSETRAPPANAFLYRELQKEQWLWFWFKWLFLMS